MNSRAKLELELSSYRLRKWRDGQAARAHKKPVREHRQHRQPFTRMSDLESGLQVPVARDLPVRPAMSAGGPLPSQLSHPQPARHDGVPVTVTNGDSNAVTAQGRRRAARAVTEVTYNHSHVRTPIHGCRQGLNAGGAVSGHGPGDPDESRDLEGCRRRRGRRPVGWAELGPAETGTELKSILDPSPNWHFPGRGLESRVVTGSAALLPGGVPGVGRRRLHGPSTGHRPSHFRRDRGPSPGPALGARPWRRARLSY